MNVNQTTRAAHRQEPATAVLTATRLFTSIPLRRARQIAAQQDAYADTEIEALNDIMADSLSMLEPNVQTTPSSWANLFINGLGRYFVGMQGLILIAEKGEGLAALQRRGESGNLRLHGSWTTNDAVDRDLHVISAQNATLCGAPDSAFQRYRTNAMPALEQLFAALPVKVWHFARDEEIYDILECTDQTLANLQSTDHFEILEGLKSLSALCLKLRVCRVRTDEVSRDRLELLRLRGAVNMPFDTWQTCLCPHVDAHSRRANPLALNAIRDLASASEGADEPTRRAVSETLLRSFRCKAEDHATFAAFSTFLTRPESRLAPLLEAFDSAGPVVAGPAFEKLARLLVGVDAGTLKATLIAEQEANFSQVGIDSRTRKRIVNDLHVFAARTLACLLPALESSPQQSALASALLIKLGIDPVVLQIQSLGHTVESNIVDMLARELPRAMFSVEPATTTVNAHAFGPYLTSIVVSESLRRSDRQLKIDVGSGSHSDPQNYERGMPPVRAAVLKAAAAAGGWQVEEFNQHTLVVYRPGTRRTAQRGAVDLTPFRASVSGTEIATRE